MYVHTLMHVLPFVYAAMNAASTQIVLVLLAADCVCSTHGMLCLRECIDCISAGNAADASAHTEHPVHPAIRATNRMLAMQATNQAGRRPGWQRVN